MTLPSDAHLVHEKWGASDPQCAECRVGDSPTVSERVHKRNCLLLETDPDHDGWCPTVSEPRTETCPTCGHVTIYDTALFNKLSEAEAAPTVSEPRTPDHCEHPNMEETFNMDEPPGEREAWLYCRACNTHWQPVKRRAEAAQPIDEEQLALYMHQARTSNDEPIFDMDEARRRARIVAARLRASDTDQENDA